MRGWSSGVSLFALLTLGTLAPVAFAQEVVPPSAPAPAKPAPAGARRAPAPKPAVHPAPAKSGPTKVLAKTGKKGKPPKRPSPIAPAGTPRGEPNEAARKKIAATGSEARDTKKDPELEALRAAERVLFPKPLAGSTPDFAWDLPKPVDPPGAEVHASGLPPSVASDPGLDDSEDQATDAEWIRSLTMPDLPVRLESRVVRYLKFYRDNPKGKAIARAWAKKSGRYASALEAALGKAGLPTGLVWLSLIESGHNPTIVSPAGAAGLWQFMPEAARIYGLTVDRWVDERLDPERSTEAAIAYLSDLQRRFGSWELAMAAYNMGYAGLAKAIRKFNTNDYWELCRYEAGIPWETTLYVPKIFAIAVVMANKKAFGLDDVSVDPPESFDKVVVAPGLSLERVAQAARLTSQSLEALNPQLLAGRAPPARSGQTSAFKVRVPAGSARRIGAELAKAGELEPELEPYTMRLGDTLATLARDRGTDERTIIRANRIRDDEVLAPGTVLLVPKRAVIEAKDGAMSEEVVVVSPREYRYPNRERVFYRVQTGDTLGRIAAAFAVAKSEVESWNALDPSARLQAGMMLQIWIKPGTDLGAVRAIRERDARVLVAGSPEFFDYFEGLNGKKRIVVEAKDGDTLATLGRRYGMSVGWMERINRRSRKKKLEAGDKLVVYVPGGRVPAKVAGAADSDSDEPWVIEPGPGDTTPASVPPSSDKPSAGG